jgi:ATP-dependent DNA helicase RecQ
LFNAHDRGVHDRMRENGNVDADLVRQVWHCLVELSQGRRPVPLDDSLIAKRLGKATRIESVATALSLLEERGVLTGISRAETVRLRLLATPLRLECDRHTLSAQALALLLEIMSRAPDGPDWITWSASANGMPRHRFDSLMGELESRQLVLWISSSGDRWSGRHRLERACATKTPRRERAKLGAMVGYATSLTCRRRYVLNYFGDRSTAVDGCRCDICDPAVK